MPVLEANPRGVLHLVLLNQYYPPDAAPTGWMLAGVAETLAAAGHQVTVICSRGGYAGGGGAMNPPPSSVRIVRVGAPAFGRKSFLGKLVDYVGYYLGVAWHLAVLTPKPDRIVALTTPPYLSILARIFSCLRGGDHAHWVMDLYPDVMVAHGMLREGSLPHRMLARLTRTGFAGRRCATVLCLGEDMRERLRSYVSESTDIAVVPLWSSAAADPPPELVARLRVSRGWAPEDLVLMYSGNMGLGHRFGEFLEAAVSPPLPGVRFSFHGDGKRRIEIEAAVRERPDAAIELHGYAPGEQLAAHLASADVHLASLEPSWDGCMVPSKLQGIFAAGRPVIFVGSRQSSIGRWVEESGGGWVVGPGDIAALHEAIREAAAPAERLRRGNAARAFADGHFHRERNLAEVSRILSGETRH